MDNHQERMELVYKTGHLSEKKRNLLYSLAWQMGHSCGEHEVEIYYSDLAELALCE